MLACCWFCWVRSPTKFQTQSIINLVKVAFLWVVCGGGGGDGGGGVKRSSCLTQPNVEVR